MKEDTSNLNPDDAAAQLASLQAENERLRAQLEQAASTKPAGGTARNTISLILVVLGIVAVVFGVLAAWLQTTIADEERFVDTFGALPKDQAVAVVLSERLADELVVNAGVAETVERLLPSELGFLAVPVTDGIYNLTVDTAGRIITSDVFTGIWRSALRLSHASTSAVLSTGGKLSIDLNEAAGEVVAALEDRGVTVLSETEIELPEIILFQNEQLEQAADVLDVVDTLGWFVPLIALVLFIGALWVSTDRRRTTAYLGFGTAFGLVLTLVIVRLVRGGTVGDLDDETQRAAAEAVWDTTLRFYRQAMWAFIVMALVVGFAAWVTGPSERAGRIRAWWHRTIARRRGLDAEAPTSGVTGFIATWKRPLQWGILTIGLLVLLFGPNPSGWLVIVIALIVLALIAVIEVVAGPKPADESLIVEEDEVAAMVDEG